MPCPVSMAHLPSAVGRTHQPQRLAKSLPHPPLHSTHRQKTHTLMEPRHQHLQQHLQQYWPYFSATTSSLR